MTLVIYLSLCVMVALLGRKTKLGFFRGFLFCVMLTPFAMMFYLLIFTTLDPEEDARSQVKVKNPTIKFDD
ncbi:hypothetical protein [Azonexus sp.]|uniref:hypothetical protein n=1 Tax=Azonexus sp. TaxID=1872668 RepID=UPI0027B8B5C7|nr:hypothetical protein [Azonexus sp.]